MKLATLADVSDLIGHLPAEHRKRPSWKHVTAEPDKAGTAADLLSHDEARKIAANIVRLPDLLARPQY
jgi:hypothetical protein